MLLLALAAMVTAATAVPAGAQPTGPTLPSAPPAPSSSPASSPGAVGRDHVSCATRRPGTFRCLSLWRSGGTDRSATGKLSTTVAKPKHGLTPNDIRAAYHLPTSKKKDTSQTIAIVDAYDNARAEQDLASYRKVFHLPKCTTANHCFRKVDQRGGKRYPQGDPTGWAVEIALDVQAVSAACPRCRILLVEADDESFAAIGAAVNTAVRLGATVVSNSYSAEEFGGMIAVGRRYYTHPKVAIVASSGDDGFQVAGFPAVLATTWAVGGTSLRKSKKHHWTEDVWDGSGSGCSAYIVKPALQGDKHCSMRTVADVSAVASTPSGGYAIYDTYGLGPDNGWLEVQGTSVSAPLVAGMIGLRGNHAAAARPTYAYHHRSGLQDVVGGSNGECGADYLCTGLKGYDAPTGLGSPRGLQAL